jgi:hypothetical protein
MINNESMSNGSEKDVLRVFEMPDQGLVVWGLEKVKNRVDFVL